MKLPKLGWPSTPLGQWLTSLALSGAAAILAVLLVLEIVDSVYIGRNPVASVEEDLGYGLVMIVTLFVSAIVALPIWGVLAWQIRRYLAQRCG